MATRFGPDILLSPPSSGLVGLVWLLPLAGAMTCVAILVVTLRRWRRNRGAVATDDDRKLVAAALSDWIDESSL